MPSKLEIFSNRINLERPWSADSLWNSYPVDPVLGDTPMTNGADAGIVASGFASSVFAAYPEDGPMEIFGLDNVAGPYVYDERRYRQVVIPRWPAGVSVAIGNGVQNDGHLEIIDLVTRGVHSFYRMERVDGQWKARNYAYYSLDGDGFGTPSRAYGPRAAGVPSVGGILRAHEHGQSIVRHPIALCPNAQNMKSGPASPATLEDGNGASAYVGVAPMGSLWLLPSSFDAEALHSDEMRCIARTLKKYGCRVVDTTTAPYWTFIAENGSNWNRNTAPEWYNDLSLMRQALRMVTGQSGFRDRDGNAITPKDRSQKNLVSLRQLTRLAGTGTIGQYDTVRDAYVFADGQGSCTAGKAIGKTYDSPQNTSQSGQPWWRWIYGNYWYSNPEPGVTYNVVATGGGTGITGRVTVGAVNSGYLAPGQSAQITVAADWDGSGAVHVQRNTSVGEAWLKLEMTKV